MTSILLVEDDIQLAGSIVSLIEDTGAEVTHTREAKDAMELLRERRFDMLITDYSVIGGTADMILGVAKTEQPETFRLAISGSRTAEWVVEAELADVFHIKDVNLGDAIMAEIKRIAPPAL